MRKYLQVTARIIWLPFVVLRDFAEMDSYAGIKNITRWVFEPLK